VDGLLDAVFSSSQVLEQGSYQQKEYSSFSLRKMNLRSKC
jgi:hypothetical protein